MALNKYSRYKIVIESKKQQGLRVGDVVRRQYVDSPDLIYSLMVVLETGSEIVREKESHYFVGALVEGDEPRQGELLDFVRMTSLCDRDRGGALYLTASDSDAPYLDVIDGMGLEHSLYLQEKPERISAGESFVFGINGKVENPERIVIWYKARASKLLTGVPLTFGYRDGSQADGTDSVDISTAWQYKLTLLTIDYPAQYSRQLTITPVLTGDEWCEVSDLNVARLSSIATFGDATKARMGKIKGIVDPVFGVLEGYGAYFQNLYATRNVNIAGTLTAGDENGFASTFYVGKIHKNVIADSTGCLFSGSIAVSDDSPAGIGNVVRTNGNTELRVQSAAWRMERTGKRYTFSVWIKAGEGRIAFYQDEHYIQDVQIVTAGEWRRYKITFTIALSQREAMYVRLETEISDFLLTAPQMESGGNASQYQPTDEQLSYVEDYGAWFNKGGIGGTIQNPLLRLNEDGSICSRNGSFTIQPDGTGHFAGGKFSWTQDDIVLRDMTIRWADLDEEAKDLLLSHAKPGVDANLLDWVEEWNSGKTVIDGQSVITPKIFAGVKNANNTITGTAIGKFTLSTRNASGMIVSETVNGIYGFADGKKTFEINATGNVQLGNGNECIKYNAATGKVEFGAAVALAWVGATYIGSGGIFTGTLSANTVNAIRINASQIAAGVIDAARINTDALKAVLITAGNIEALTLNVVRGRIGGWSVDTDSIYSGTKNNTSGGFTAGSNSITIGSTGIRGGKWRLESTGAGALAGGNINWDAAGNVVFGPSVALNWTNAANSALASAKSYADSIEVGGRNLIRYKRDNGSSYFEGFVAVVTETGDIIRGVSATSIPGWPRIGNSSVKNLTLEMGSDYTLSFFARANKECVRWCGIDDPGGLNGVMGMECAMGTDWRKMTRTFRPLKQITELCYFQIYTGDSYPLADATNWIEIKEVKLEKGNKATGWTPAPEDVDYLIGKAQSVADGSVNALGGATYPKLTNITGSGIYTGTLTAGQITAGTIHADRIAAGSIHSSKLDAASIKANIINTNYINGLSCTFVQGKIGGWNIGSDNISIGTPGQYSETPMQLRMTSAGSGYWYSGNYKPLGLSILWHQPSNAGHLVLGQVAASGHTVKTGYIGLQMMSEDSREYFCLSANTTRSGSKEVYNRIAGWGFDESSIWKNNVYLGGDGSITNAAKWKLNNDGSGQLAGGAISWNAAGVVSFAPAVSLNWTNAANNGKLYARGTGLNHNASSIVALNGVTILDSLTRGLTLSILNRSDLSVVSQTNYDTYINDPNCNALAAVLNGLDSSKIVILTSFDAIQINAALNVAIQRCGGSDLIVSSSRTPYCFIGIPGIGKNNGLTAVSELGASDPFAELSTIVINGTPQGINTNGKQNTHIDGNGIYTGIVNAGQITAGTIDTARLDAASIQANIINTNYINGLSCTFTQGSIGGWTIGGDSMCVGTLGIAGQTPIQMRTVSTGNGYWYDGQYKPFGISMTWHQSSNAGHLVFGQIAASGNSVKTGYIGLQMMSWFGLEYFCLSANYLHSGSLEVYNRIAGWAFDSVKIWKNNVTLGSDGTISNGSNWAFRNDGSGQVANGNISWNVAGAVSFSSAVSLSWKQDIENAKTENFGYRYATSIVIYGESGKYYPVVIKGGDQSLKRNILVRRNFYEQAAPDWTGSATHMGGLALHIKTNFGSWGGAAYSWNIYELDEIYSQLFAGAEFCGNCCMFAIFLRGGGNTGALYHLYSDQPLDNPAYSSPPVPQTVPQIAYNSDMIFNYIGNMAYAPAPRTITAAVEAEIRSHRYATSTYIDASGIYTGTVSAGQVYVDSALVVGGSSYNGSISVRDASDNVKVTLDRTGITAVGGKIGGWLIGSHAIYASAPAAGHRVYIYGDGQIFNDNGSVPYWALNPDGSAVFSMGKISFKNDGSGFVANGNVSWDTVGNVSMSGTITATAGNISGFQISGNRLMNTAANSSIEFTSLLGNAFLYVNGNGALLSMRADSARTGISISTYANGAIGLKILANSGSSYAISSFGPHEFGQREGEKWNAPGVLFAGRIRGGSLIVRWGNGLTYRSLTTTNGNGTYRIEHNLGHTEYIVIANPYYDPSSTNVHLNCFIRIEHINTTYFNLQVVNADNGKIVASELTFAVIGRNTW